MDGTPFSPSFSPSIGIAAPRQRRRLTEAEIDSLADQAVAAQAAALALMSSDEKRALCNRAIAQAARVVGCDQEPEDAARRLADLPGITWCAMTDLAWARARAKKRISAGYTASIDLDARTLARIAINYLDSYDDRESRQGRNVDGKWNGVESTAQWADGAGEPEHVIVDRDTPDMALEMLDGCAVLWLLNDIESLLPKNKLRSAGGAP